MIKRYKIENRDIIQRDCNKETCRFAIDRDDFKKYDSAGTYYFLIWTIKNRGYLIPFEVIRRCSTYFKGNDNKFPLSIDPEKDLITYARLNEDISNYLIELPSLNQEEIKSELKTYISLKVQIQQSMDDIDAMEYQDSRCLSEGTKHERLTCYYERKPKLRAEAIKIHGMKCMACDFDFAETYGERGEGFIEVHHVKPISEIGEETLVDPQNDLIVVCSNCHRIIHRYKNNVIGLDKLKEMIEKKRKICKIKQKKEI